MLNNELNSMCINCKSLNKDCSGTYEKVYTGCIYKKITGQNVRITNPHFNNRTGKIKDYLWNTQDYLIIMDDNKKILPFKKSEFEIIE